MEQVSNLFYHWKDHFPDKVTPVSFWEDLMRWMITNTLRLLLCNGEMHNAFTFIQGTTLNCFYSIRHFIFFTLFYRKNTHLAVRFQIRKDLKEKPVFKIPELSFKWKNMSFSLTYWIY